MSRGIGQVIGWKFNHQEGMRTEDGIITDFPGGIPSQADQDKWTSEWEAAANDRAFAALREKRDQLLNDTDWWASSDLSISEDQTSYRQTLRDLPANTTDPTNITWPEKP